MRACPGRRWERSNTITTMRLRTLLLRESAGQAQAQGTERSTSQARQTADRCMAIFTAAAPPARSQQGQPDTPDSSS